MTSLNCLTENLFLLLMAPAAILYAGESDKIGAKIAGSDEMTFCRRCKYLIRQDG